MEFEEWLKALTDTVESGGWQAVGAHDLAQLAHGLIAREVSPGGPYRDDRGDPTRRFNLTVARLFRSLGSPLPVVEAFVSAKAGPATKGVRIKTHPALSPVQTATERVIAGMSGEMRAPATQAYRRILRADAHGEISQLSRLFSRSLPGNSQADDVLTADLGVANLLVWMAYSLYDDVIDDEGTPRFLPVANVAHREAFSRYLAATPNALASECRRIFDGMDAANAWEIAHCRFGVRDGQISIGPLPRYSDYSVLAARARAHVLGPLIVARSVLGINYDIVAQALDHYLIARQLNDDLHDWGKDIGRGHISPVVARIINAASRAGSPIRGSVALDTLLPRLKDVFWRTELRASSRRARSHITKARRLLTGPGVTIPDGSEFIVRVIDPIGDVLRRGLDRHQADKDFLAAYKSPVSTIAR